MYKKAIKENSNYLVPFVEGIKYYGSDEIENASGTLIILNENADILTCKHIAEQFLINQELIQRYQQFQHELNNCKNNEEKKNIEKKFNIKKGLPILSKIELPFKLNGELYIKVIFHKYLDLAIIRLGGIKFENLNYPVFSENIVEQGQSVCKLGYAFPEYDLFEFSNNENNIIIKDDKFINFPLFPMDGIVTRHVSDEHGILSMFETSSPGLRGQSGGPIFGPEGIVYGIQSMTVHLDLNFDVNGEVKRGLKRKKVTYNPFINLGIGISSVEIIKFLNENKIKYTSK